MRDCHLRPTTPSQVPEGAERLATCLSSGDAATLRTALAGLTTLGPAALAPHAGAVIERLRDIDAGVRLASLQALGTLSQLGPTGLEPYAAAVAEALADTEASVRLGALQVLMKLERGSLVCLADAVMAVLEDENPSIRAAALEVFERLGPQAEGALAQHSAGIALKLKDSDYNVRLCALRVLGNLRADCLTSHLSSILLALQDSCPFVRSAAVEALAQLAPAQFMRHSCMVANAMELGDPTVCRWVAEVLAGLGPERLPPHMSSVLPALRNRSAQVRASALQLLRTAPPQALAPHALAVGGLLRSSDPDVRVWALRVLADLETSALLPHLGAGLAALADRCPDTRSAALALLQKVVPIRFAPHAADVASLLQGGDAEVSLWALRVLERFLPVNVEPYGELLLAALRNEDQRLSSAALALLKRMRPAALGPHADVVAAIVLEGEGRKRLAAFQVLVRLNADDLEWHAAATLSAFKAWSVEDRTACLATFEGLPISLLGRWAHSTATDGSTLLHLAAEDGRRELCRKLVDQNSCVAAKNNKGRTALDVARRQKHVELAKFLEQSSRRRLSMVRSGQGDAYFVSQKDNRSISQVEWYTLEMPGLAGRLGLKHSFIAVTVGDPQAGPGQTWTYVFEKAQRESARDASCSQYENGVHISHWHDVARVVKGNALHRLTQSDLVNNTGKPELCLRSLRDVSVELGPYDLATCNCHHAALAIYNACAKESARISRIPNRALVSVTKGLKLYLGLDVANVPGHLGGLRRRKWWGRPHKVACSTGECAGSRPRAATAPLPSTRVPEL